MGKPRITVLLFIIHNSAAFFADAEGKIKPYIFVFFIYPGLRFNFANSVEIYWFWIWSMSTSVLLLQF
jgi:hypothetical protein